MEEKELYSKAFVAGSIRFVVDEAEENIDLKEYENFSCNLATILARDTEVVAVRLIPYPDRCVVYIAKNRSWLGPDIAYIDKIKKYMKSLSNDAPIKLVEALRRKDAGNLFREVLKYCSAKIKTRFKKLRDDIIYNQQKPYIKSFLEYAEIGVEDIWEVDGCVLSEICSSYYNKFKSTPAPEKSPALEKFLRHIKKVGSYYSALIDIIACASKDKYKLLFSNMQVHRLEPIVIPRQSIFSWKSIVQRVVPDHAEYEKFKGRCLDDHFTSERLDKMYGNVDRLDNENIGQEIYLHAEMNLLTNIVDQEYKERAFIAVSKRSCYLCESYIRFVNKKGYKIFTSGAHKKLYPRWLLPRLNDTNLRNESLKDMIKQVDQVINEEIAKHVSIVARSDSDGESVKTDTELDIRKIGQGLLIAYNPYIH